MKTSVHCCLFGPEVVLCFGSKSSANEDEYVLHCTRPLFNLKIKLKTGKGSRDD